MLEPVQGLKPHQRKPAEPSGPDFIKLPVLTDFFYLFSTKTIGIGVNILLDFIDLLRRWASLKQPLRIRATAGRTRLGFTSTFFLLNCNFFNLVIRNGESLKHAIYTLLRDT
jgi:hypothetical protein